MAQDCLYGSYIWSSVGEREREREREREKERERETDRQTERVRMSEGINLRVREGVKQASIPRRVTCLS